MQQLCEYCGREFSYYGRQRTKKYCSRACYIAQLRQHWPLPETLQRLYWDEKLSLKQMERVLGIDDVSIFTAMVHYNISRRSAGDGLRLGFQQGRIKANRRRGENHPNWGGGKQKMSGGYIGILQPDHPRAGKKGYVREHILVWEAAHNTTLPQGWVVHHLNGVVDDNRAENLVALPNTRHKNVLAAKAKRIRDLEAKVKLLTTTVQRNQGVFNGFV